MKCSFTRVICSKAMLTCMHDIVGLYVFSYLHKYEAFEGLRDWCQYGDATVAVHVVTVSLFTFVDWRNNGILPVVWEGNSLVISSSVYGLSDLYNLVAIPCEPGPLVESISLKTSATMVDVIVENLNEGIFRSKNCSK